MLAHGLRRPNFCGRVCLQARADRLSVLLYVEYYCGVKTESRSLQDQFAEEIVHADCCYI